MNKLRGNLATTRTRFRTLFHKCYRIFYMLGRTNTSGHTKAFDYPVMDHWGEVKMISVMVQGGLKPRTCRSTDEHANRYPSKTPLERKSVIVL